MDNSLIRGDINELQCILDFQKRGYYCSIPFSGSCRYDVVVDINNNLYRIQCKCSTYHEDKGALVMDCTRSTTNTKTTTRYTYSKEEIDYFYTSWNNYGFLVPVNETSTCKYLRVKLPKGRGIQETMSIAADYLLDNVINAIINNQDIARYQDKRIISWKSSEEEYLWSTKELKEKYKDAQIKYIKECIAKNKMAYGYNWKFKEFPEL